MKNGWVKILAHACIILVLVLLTLLVFDYLNPTMDFVNNAIAKGFVALLCLFGFIVSLLLLVTYRRK